MWCSPRRRNFNPRTPRGVRRPEPQRLKPMSDFNPRTPRGVRPPTKGIMLGGFFISIHAPREGCDSRCPQPELPKTQFQSTHPARGATWPTDDIDEAARISIHAPREGCDMARSGLRRLTWISIHAPREGCDACPVTWSAAQRRISIHAPREGCDGRRPDRRPSSPDFNPRTPRGVRLGQGPQGGLLH